MHSLKIRGAANSRKVKARKLRRERCVYIRSADGKQVPYEPPRAQPAPPSRSSASRRMSELFTCMCGKAFRGKTNLFRHVRVCTRGQPDWVPLRVRHYLLLRASAGSYEAKRECGFCWKVCSSTSNLHKHKRRCAVRDKIAPCQSPGPHGAPDFSWVPGFAPPCEHGGAAAPAPGGAAAPVEFSCTLCEYKGSAAGLRRHVRKARKHADLSLAEREAILDAVLPRRKKARCVCFTCKSRFRGQAALSEHLVNDHGLEQFKKVTVFFRTREEALEFVHKTEVVTGSWTAGAPTKRQEHSVLRFVCSRQIREDRSLADLGGAPSLRVDIAHQGRARTKLKRMGALKENIERTVAGLPADAVDRMVWVTAVRAAHGLPWYIFIPTLVELDKALRIVGVSVGAALDDANVKSIATAAAEAAARAGHAPGGEHSAEAATAAAAAARAAALMLGVCGSAEPGQESAAASVAAAAAAAAAGGESELGDGGQRVREGEERRSGRIRKRRRLHADPQDRRKRRREELLDALLRRPGEELRPLLCQAALIVMRVLVKRAVSEPASAGVAGRRKKTTEMCPAYAQVYSRDHDTLKYVVEMVSSHCGHPSAGADSRLAPLPIGVRSDLKALQQEHGARLSHRHVDDYIFKHKSQAATDLACATEAGDVAAAAVAKATLTFWKTIIPERLMHVVWKNKRKYRSGQSEEHDLVDLVFGADCGAARRPELRLAAGAHLFPPKRDLNKWEDAVLKCAQVLCKAAHVRSRDINWRYGVITHFGLPTTPANDAAVWSCAEELKAGTPQPLLLSRMHGAMMLQVRSSRRSTGSHLMFSPTHSHADST